MRVWALASHELNETLDLFRTKHEAEEALATVLADEPDWRDLLYITPVDLDEPVSRPPFN